LGVRGGHIPSTHATPTNDDGLGIDQKILNQMMPKQRATYFQGRVQFHEEGTGASHLSGQE